MSGPPRPASSDEVRTHIVSSLFSRKDEQGTPEETLISFLKVFEQEDGSGYKTRYLMLAGEWPCRISTSGWSLHAASIPLSQPGKRGIGCDPLLTPVTKLGRVVIHKAKRNNNLSFSKGKTWSLEDMRGLEVISVSYACSSSRG